MLGSMTSSRPYMIRAIYEWVVDNDCTPYILVNAMQEGVQVPQQFVQDGQIVLNISPTAVVGLDVGNDELGFRGRFGGVAQDVRGTGNLCQGKRAGHAVRLRRPGSSSFAIKPR